MWIAIGSLRRAYRKRFLAVIVIGSLLLSDVVLADALVVTQAMKASTIAEIFVDQGEIRVHIEVGGADIEVFKNLLPDELFEKVTGQVVPLEERLRTFLEDDWLLRADGRKLVGEMEGIELAKRVTRDEITGVPLPNQPEDAEIVIRTKCSYQLETKPKSISILPPQVDSAAGKGLRQANIGFVVYHQGIAVNDFRYLSQQQTLNLDWSDPWYSVFDHRNLRRRYFTPAAAFIYVENFEVRKEIVIRPKDLQHWVDLGLAGKTTIEVPERDAICEKAAAFLAEHSAVTIDAERSQGTLDRVNFIERSLRTAGVVEPGQEIDVNGAMIGAIYVYPIESLPENVTMAWDLFSDRITQVPTVTSDQAGEMPGSLEPDNAVLVWQNFLKNPTIPAFLEVAPPARPRVLTISFITIICLVAIVWLWLRERRPAPHAGFHSLLATLCLLAIGIGATYWPKLSLTVPLEKQQLVSDTAGGDITHSLLHNIYRAFDYRDEGTIYDVISRSASGDLLTKVYLEMRESLTLASQGGARVKVKEVELISCQVEPSDDDTFVATCSWTVSGSVGHWGHIHQRKNRYDGEFKVQAIDQQWKLTGMELLNEERL
jgi:hypothetical protein